MGKKTETMRIRQIKTDKKRYLSLLLQADEQEDMIDRYLECGQMFALYDAGVRTVAVVTDEGDGICELKNLSTVPACRGQGYGKHMVQFLIARFRRTHHTMLVGTDDFGGNIAFYQNCGFMPSHRVKDFFTDHYDHPIFEGGRQLRDMVYLARDLKTRG